jgi:glycosyltransferase involved in cell wall biosynthesis
MEGAPMRIDVLARSWGSPSGGPNGMAIAAAFLACTLAELGHEVRRLPALDGFGADLIITTISPTWRRTAAMCSSAGALERLVYWHHAGGVPAGYGCTLAAPPSISPQDGWSRHVVLPPSSWAAEAGGDCIGGEILVPGAGPAKGGHVALAVARLCSDLRWYVLQGRSSTADRAPWRALPHAEVSQWIVEPQQILARARAVLAPTRFEVHPLLLVEAAVRGIPIVCTDLASTREATGATALYVPMSAPPSRWAAALREVLEMPRLRLKLPPYAEVARAALEQMQERRAAA